jgi:hypothetical protein
MQPHPAETETEPSRGHRWLTVAAVVVVIALVTVLALIFVPVHTVSRELTVSSTTPVSTEFSVPGQAWGTVHFDRYGNSGMMYWMNGPSGMMFNRSMMGGGMMGGADSYSFGTWGGTFHCAAAYAHPGSGSMRVWVKMTWGLL